MEIDYDGRIFFARENSIEGDVDSRTRFHYHQKETYLWGHYSGGQVRSGVLLGRVMGDSSLEFSYWHYDLNGDFKQGKCRSTPSILEDGRIQLNEKWQWTNGNCAKGRSIIQEIK